MTLKWRFSGGLLFSLTLHFFLLSALLFWYPEMMSKENWQLENWALFSANENKFPVLDPVSIQNSGEIKSAGILIFPNIVLAGKKKKIISKTSLKKKIQKPQISIKGILEQVVKFPERLNKSEFSKKPLSRQLSKILTLLDPVSLQNSLPKKSRVNLNSKELIEYHKQLKVYLSERWEVPINLIESQSTAVIQFEITKNGRLLSWQIEESANSILNKTVKNMLKNLQFLPSLPKSYPEDSYKFGVRFTPANFQL